METLSRVVTEKLRREDGIGSERPSLFSDDVLELAVRQVEALERNGKLTERHLLQVAGENTTPLIAAALARLANVSIQSVVEVIRTASAKGMLAMCWAADFSAEAAAQLQVKVARVPPADVIGPRPGGGFDATQDELEWQIEMFTDLAAQHAEE